MTAPPAKDLTGRPPIEMGGATADSPLSGIGSGICTFGAGWGDGSNAATVIAGEYAQLPRVPFELDLERFELLAYDTAGNPLAIDAVVDVLATDYATNSFASIAGTELPTLSSAAKAESVTLTGWRLINPTDTMYRFVLVSFTGAPGKIVLGIRAFAP